jgi:hypothetical protein
MSIRITPNSSTPVLVRNQHQHGAQASNSGLNQIDYGFEICSTAGAETFTVSQFSVKSS